MKNPISLTALTLGMSLSIPLSAVEEEPTIGITANNLSWAYAFNKGNAQALADLYTDNAIVMPPSDETLTTRESIEEYWNERFSNGLGDFAVDHIELEVKDDEAFQAGVWSATVTESNGKKRYIGGNVVSVLEKQADGSWKTRLTSWN